MPLNPSLASPRRSWQGQIPEAWRRPLAYLALAWGAILLLTGRAWADMAHQWWHSDAYGHILLIPPILVWLVWNRWSELSQLRPQAWWPGLLALGGALLFWLMGRVGGVNLAEQLGAVLALQAAFAAVMGPRVVAGLLFPLCYMIFMVPFGDELVPGLQMITAKIVTTLVDWSGMTARINGVFIETPIGLFEVAEACSGVKFLIAMLALGTLVANTCFKSWKRRAIFMAFAIALPILANGLRAWGTIVIAQYQGIEFAAGFDHIFYGWVFFAIVVALLFAISWRYFDRSTEESPISAQQIMQNPLLTRLSAATIKPAAGGAILAAMLLGFALWAGAASRLSAATPAQIAFPAVPGWERVYITGEPQWNPRAAGADHRLRARYRNASGREVDVFFALYAAQNEESEATALGEGAINPDSAWRWSGPAALPAVSSAEVHGEWMLAEGHIRRLAATSYRRGDYTTGDAKRFKLYVMTQNLMLRAQPSMMLITSAVETPDQDPELALEEFYRALDNGSEWMDAAAGLR